MRLLRERWERRIAMRMERGMEPPALGLREDIAYRVFPREMTVPAELAVRRAYLALSRELLIERYGRGPLAEADRESKPLDSSYANISEALFCFEKNKTPVTPI